MESAYQAQTGTASPVVLRSGDKGAAVRRLQDALGVNVDGSFGPETDRAVREFQRRAGLAVDGIVGMQTWAAIKRLQSVDPVKQPAKEDRIARASEVVALAGTAGGTLATFGQALPESSLNLLIAGVVLFGLVALALHAFRKVRG